MPNTVEFIVNNGYCWRLDVVVRQGKKGYGARRLETEEREQDLYSKRDGGRKKEPWREERATWACKRCKRNGSNISVTVLNLLLDSENGIPV